MKSLKNSTKILKRIIQIAPFLMIAVCAVLYFTQFRHVTVDRLLRYTPENIWLASLVLIGMFSLKSLSFFFPMLVIVAACGRIAPNFWAAALISTIGIFCMMNIPYFIGRFAERELVEEIFEKHPKIQKVHDIHMNNEVYFVFFLRIINCLPYDVVSMFLGSTKISWWKYILGSMIGTLPGMICTIFMGLSIDDPLSPMFIISAAVDVVISVCFGISYIVYMKKQKKNA